ncbi:B3 domain-containing protein Os03g0620400-like [Triticum dicoccoides]|uniref:B3 domain-containing protein Os03g0620400-like n=1 Tax=Triticum dicoccoides TaxID=85692 RepID=UPI00188DCB08|nr:B3 domain-containing protein Os03g0620400-like [Triticum dicoccoides]
MEELEFFMILLPNFLKKLRLPDKFTKLLDGREPREVKLREAGCRRRLWDVEVVSDTDGHMYLGNGWEQFARAHDMRLGHFLVLSYDGHAVLTVKVFDGSMCRRHYHQDNDASSGSSSDCGNPLFFIMYMVQSLAQQGAEGEGEALSQTGAEEDDGEQCISKMSNPCDSDESQKERSHSAEELSAEDTLSVDNSVESANPQTLSNNYVLSTQCYPTKAQRVKIDALIEKIKPKFTVLVVQMKKSNVKRHATLIIQKDYALEHFPCEDTTVMLQLPGKNKDWKCTLRIRPSGVSYPGQRNLYLRNFSCDNHVREGDICLFQPITSVKHRRFIVKVHILHKVSIDHSPGGTTGIGSNRGSTSAKMGGVKDEPPTDGEEYSSEHEEHEVSEDSEGAFEHLFMLSNGASLTPAQNLKCLEKVEGIKFKPPFYVAIMSKSTVCQRGSQRCPSLHFGSQYAATYLVQKFSADLHREENSRISLVLQREGKSRSWPTKLQYKYRTRGTSNQMTVHHGWPSFARDNHLRDGDICLFKLMDNEEQLSMMVYIVRR